MANKDFILQALSEYSCVTTKELSNYIKRTYNQSISPSFIASALRTYIQEGKVAKSDCGIGVHYWVIN